MKKYTIENNISELFKVAAIISAIIGGIKDIDELHKFIDLFQEYMDKDIRESKDFSYLSTSYNLFFILRI